jgi:hypothetical protein
VQVDLVSSAMDFADFVDHLICGEDKLCRQPVASEVTQGQRFSCGGLAMTPVSLPLLIRRASYTTCRGLRGMKRDEMVRHEFASGEEPTVYTADIC